MYTKCSAPTKVYMSDTIIAPGGTTYVKWEGGRPGANMSIASYDIYRATSASGTYTYLSSVVGANTLQAQVTAPTTRGSSYYYKIITNGSVAGYYSDLSTAYASVKANSLPNIPQVSVDKTSVPSSGGTVKFTATAGSDSDGQTRTLYYATSSTGTKTRFTSPLSQTITSNSNYYFYTYDGVEYSSAKIISISLNEQPTITINESATESSLSSYTVGGKTGAYYGQFQLGYAYAVKPQISVNKPGNLRVIAELSYGNDPYVSFLQHDPIYTYVFSTYSISSLNNITLDNYNLNNAAVERISETNRNLYDVHWRLMFILNDGFEDSEPVYWPTVPSNYYTITKPPELIGPYNQFMDYDINGTNAGQVWRQVRMKFADDTSITKISISATVNGVVISPDFNTSVKNYYRYIDITLPDNIDDNSAIVITASLTNTSSSIIKKVVCNVTETLTPTMGNIDHGAPIIHPFTDTGVYQIVTTWPFGTYAELNNTTFKAYNCSTNISEAIKVVHASDIYGANQVVMMGDRAPTWEKTNDNLVANMNRKTVYGWGNELGYSTYAGSQIYYCQIQITNLFGKTVTSNWARATFDFNELAQNPTISSVEWAETNEEPSWKTFITGTSGNAVQETLYLRFGLSFGLFTADSITVNLQLANDTGTNTVVTEQFSENELSRATNRNAASNTVYVVYGPVNNISTSNNYTWKLQVVTTRGTVLSEEGTIMRVQRQTAPAINFVSCSTTKEYNLTYKFEQTDDGGGELEYYLYSDGSDLSNELNTTSNTEVSSESNIETIIKSGTIESLVKNWEVKSICIKSVSTVVGLITRTATYYSNYIIVYKITPTVSYRKNQLGINTNTPSEGAVVDIHQSTGNDSILFQGINEDGATLKFAINILNGTITFSKITKEGTVLHTLDMMNGTLT